MVDINTDWYKKSNRGKYSFLKYRKNDFFLYFLTLTLIAEVVLISSEIVVK